jgi:hypothetical protein
MSAVMLTKTSQIKNEFSQLIDDDTEYSMKEMKDVLSNIYKTLNRDKKSKTIIKNTATIVVTEDSDDDDDKPKKRGRPAKPAKKDKNGNVMAKKAPSAYNLFVQEKIVSIRKEQPDVPAKERMSLAAAAWKEMSDEDKEVYKTMKATNDAKAAEANAADAADAADTVDTAEAKSTDNVDTDSDE